MNIDKYVYESGLIASGCWDKFDDYDQKALEKFAELIIQECFWCIAIMEKSANSNNASIPKDYDKHTYLETLGTMRGLLETHFGVE